MPNCGDGSAMVKKACKRLAWIVFVLKNLGFVQKLRMDKMAGLIGNIKDICRSNICDSVSSGKNWEGNPTQDYDKLFTMVALKRLGQWFLYPQRWLNPNPSGRNEKSAGNTISKYGSRCFNQFTNGGFTDNSFLLQLSLTFCRCNKPAWPPLGDSQIPNRKKGRIPSFCSLPAIVTARCGFTPRHLSIKKMRWIVHDKMDFATHSSRDSSWALIISSSHLPCAHGRDQSARQDSSLVCQRDTNVKSE